MPKKKVTKRVLPPPRPYEASTCQNCAHAFGGTPCPRRDFRLRPRYCPTSHSWVPLGYLPRPISEEERMRIIVEALTE
jgi:hypothetical protein